MSDEEIDRAICAMLSEIPGHWRKIAMVVSKVADGVGLPEGDERYQVVANRIETLVSEGRLAAQGDIKKWRFSEVRLLG